MPLNKNADYCGDCLKKAYLFNHIHALGDYKKPLSQLIKQLKYQQQLVAGELLAYLLIKSVVSRYTKQQLSAFDYLLAVPLHPKKLQLRGFNQAQIICDRLSEQLNIPLLENCITRNKETIAQEGLSIKKRKMNLSNAFSYQKNSGQEIIGKSILVIDDVVTTGATINSLCKLLKDKEANMIIVFCISRTAIDKEIQS
ncbi:amidophosphoribosyltransferase [Psychromonas sp. Urea-02u-13]|nr:amidophosphoribosyltransferase [Psychromonas sp. Urea-02u-13]